MTTSLVTWSIDHTGPVRTTLNSPGVTYEPSLGEITSGSRVELPLDPGVHAVAMADILDRAEVDWVIIVRLGRWYDVLACVGDGVFILGWNWVMITSRQDADAVKALREGEYTQAALENYYNWAHKNHPHGDFDKALTDIPPNTPTPTPGELLRHKVKQLEQELAGAKLALEDHERDAFRDRTTKLLDDYYASTALVVPIRSTSADGGRIFNFTISDKVPTGVMDILTETPETIAAAIQHLITGEGEDK